MQLESDEAPYAVVELDGDVTGVLEDAVLHVGVSDGVAQEVAASHTERRDGRGEHLCRVYKQWQSRVEKDICVMPLCRRYVVNEFRKGHAHGVYVWIVYRLSRVGLAQW